MPGQVDDMKPRKRKNHPEARSSTKGSAAGKGCRKSSKEHSAAESVPAAEGCGRLSDPPEAISRISCECHLFTVRRRCSASPGLDGQEGKENELRTAEGGDRSGDVCGGKQEDEGMDYEESGKILFPDDDSDEVLPVEQFFGNLDAVQDFPQRSPPGSPGSHREHRRRHYYAPEDSEDEEELGLGDMQPDNGAGTL